jgi:putative transposase
MAACCANLKAAQAAMPCTNASFPTCYGTEFLSRDLDLRAYANDVTLDFSRPGNPTDNGFIEAFNSKLRAECLNAHWFLSLADAREKLETWRRDYNDVRPHSAIGYKVSSALHNSVAPPACHRETAGKIQRPAVQGWGSEQSTRGRRFGGLRISEQNQLFGAF